MSLPVCPGCFLEPSQLLVLMSFDLHLTNFIFLHCSGSIDKLQMNSRKNSMTPVSSEPALMRAMVVPRKSEWKQDYPSGVRNASGSTHSTSTRKILSGGQLRRFEWKLTLYFKKDPFWWAIESTISLSSLRATETPFIVLKTPPTTDGPWLNPLELHHYSIRKIDEAFEAAKTTEDMLKAFKDMEASFDERELGLACLKLGLKLDQKGEDPEKTLSFANRALKALDRDDNRVLDDIRPILHAVQLELANSKTAMGRREEALVNLRNCLEIKEMTLEKNSREIGNANRDLVVAYVAVLNFQEALPFCLKALEIHKGQLGNNSVEVAHDKQLLGVFYTGLEEHEKALDQNQLSHKVLKNWGLSSNLLRAKIDASNIQIALGKYEEAINTLKDIVQQTDKESEDRAMIASGILDKKEANSPVEVSEAYMEIPMQYETMNSKVQEAIPYLESAAERLKECFGSKHYGVGYTYNNLGAAYLEPLLSESYDSRFDSRFDTPQSVAQMFAVAKEIMDASLGPGHVDTIESYQNLSKAYSAIGRDLGLLMCLGKQSNMSMQRRNTGSPPPPPMGLLMEKKEAKSENQKSTSCRLALELHRRASLLSVRFVITTRLHPVDMARGC
ncbi:hypothetical protein TEA_026699 [Camellia sinensis var. sinensis]|uniref:MalT-like TPR region domain-containing protein n=1 Tax=Camellia sinensis var. sinensis TaxID=542762 RepID=A0A4S4ERQ1_CAMSN|nr:hypothetical protein TEA_026699 [Camellia sinensis var. sinensis]